MSLLKSQISAVFLITVLLFFFFTPVRTEFYSARSVLFPPLHRPADGYERDHGEAHAGRKVPQRACHRAEGDHRRQREQGSLWLGQRVQVSDVSVNDDGPENVLQETKWWLEFQTKELHLLQSKHKLGSCCLKRVSILVHQMEHFLNLSDWSSVSILCRAHRKHFEKGGKALKVIGWTHQSDLFLIQLVFLVGFQEQLVTSWFRHSRMKLIG